jgi:hypothetical protein
VENIPARAFPALAVTSNSNIRVIITGKSNIENSLPQSTSCPRLHPRLYSFHEFQTLAGPAAHHAQAEASLEAYPPLLRQIHFEQGNAKQNN